VARLVRILRVLRLVSAVPQLRLIVATLVRSIPSMGHVIVLMSIILYIYGVTGYHLFHEHDADNWGTLGRSLLTLFQIVTLEGWVEVMNTALEAHRWAWIYFVSFVLIGTFVMLNLFIAVVVNAMEHEVAEEVKAEVHEHQVEDAAASKLIVEELRALREELAEQQELAATVTAALRAEVERLERDKQEAIGQVAFWQRQTESAEQRELIATRALARLLRTLQP
jgi:voltage-gated sodium channel